jgi:Flp pilus assembly protein TadD
MSGSNFSSAKSDTTVNIGAETLFGFALKAYKTGDFETAAMTFQKIIPTHYEEWQSRMYLAMSLFQAGNIEDARREFMYIRDWCTDKEMRERAESACLGINQMLREKSPVG